MTIFRFKLLLAAVLLLSACKPGTELEVKVIPGPDVLVSVNSKELKDEEPCIQSLSLIRNSDDKNETIWAADAYGREGEPPSNECFTKVQLGQLPAEFHVELGGEKPQLAPGRYTITASVGAITEGYASFEIGA